MSVQFGRWNFTGEPPTPEYTERVRANIAPYGPDSSQMYSNGGVKILYCAFHDTTESAQEIQPTICSSGAVITWDGRLDNRAELLSELHQCLTAVSTDIAIVAKAYEKWSTRCFSKLIGDWALSICNPIDRTLILAKDPIGVSHLFYSFDKDHVTWSTILNPLVLFAGKTFAICEEYIAGWFTAALPATHLTPYIGIHAVPPSSFVELRQGSHVVNKYWDFDLGKKIRYQTDVEYEEHFRFVFANAVRRRLRSDRPVLAELSGGMDSSGIVCMADSTIAQGSAETQRLDTISWYDDSDPSLDERPYFAKVEEKRGRAGCHINLRELKANNANPQGSFISEFPSESLAATPDSNRFHVQLFDRYGESMRLRGNRVTRSGIGGELPTGGGVPTPTPELQNLLATARIFELGRQLKAWATRMKKPRLPLLWRGIRGFLSTVPLEISQNNLFFAWCDPGFVNRNLRAFRGYPFRVRLFGAPPSSQHFIHALDDTRRFLAHHTHHLHPLRQARYPYLDRDLLEYACAIPREQIVRAGERRSLMKRALAGIVPDELLNRRPKPALWNQNKLASKVLPDWRTLAAADHAMVSSSLGMIDTTRFLAALQSSSRNEGNSISSLKRTLSLEAWLSHLADRGLLANFTPTRREDTSRRLRPIGAAPTQLKSSAS
jgi:asparagine synthase (glutamine-hydrolysing)